MSTSYYKNKAIAALNEMWGYSAIATFVFILINLISSLSTVLSILVTILVILPLSVGLAYSFLKLYREKDQNLLENMFKIGFNNYGHNVLGMFLVTIYTALWSLLLLVPGIIKSYSYALTPYILIEHPEMGVDASIKESMRMMEGHKLDLFILDLSFIGWFLLSILTCGIGFLFLYPYVYTAHAAFYEELKSTTLQEKVVAE